MNLRDRVRTEATPKGFYAISLKRFHKANGNVVVPNEEGYFIPQDQEELDILTHHLATGRVDFEPAAPAEQE